MDSAGADMDFGHSRTQPRSSNSGEYAVFRVMLCHATFKVVADEIADDQRRRRRRCEVFGVDDPSRCRSRLIISVSLLYRPLTNPLCVYHRTVLPSPAYLQCRPAKAVRVTPPPSTTRLHRVTACRAEEPRDIDFKVFSASSPMIGCDR